jgi:hypothetical protein
MSGEQLHGPFVHSRFVIGRIGADFASLDHAGQWGVFLDDQAVGGNVLGGQIHGNAEVLFPMFQCLARDRVDQVNAEIVEAGGAAEVNTP